MDIIKTIETINGAVGAFVWGPVMLLILVGVGVFLTLGNGFFQFTHIAPIIKNTIGSVFSKSQGKSPKGQITPFQAMTTAIASTVGVGNVAGVATAIVSGGAGAVFWMWLSAIFGMMTKYGEILLSVTYRCKSKDGNYYGGPMYYMEKGLSMKWLGVIFSFFAVFASFGIGNMNQSNEIAAAVFNITGINPLVTGYVTAALVAIVILGGISRIGKITEIIVPFMAIFYIIGGIVTLWINRALLGDAFGLIFKEAFSFQAVGGGIGGYAIARAMRFGVARGVFSNEAGLGSAPIAHATSSTRNPVHQGMWGIFEVFVDTIVICTLTALVILTSNLAGVAVNSSGEFVSGGALTSLAYQQALGKTGGLFVSVAIIFFAFSTILGWSYYGQQCVGYLTHDSVAARSIFRIIFIGFIVLGALGNLQLLWNISDTLNGLMAIPNLTAVILLSPVILKTTNKYKQNPKSVEM